MSIKGTILIVEYEVGPREAIRMILKPFYELVTACNGEDAIEIIQNQKIDVVTLDLNMPGLTGFDVLKHFLIHFYTNFRTVLLYLNRGCLSTRKGSKSLCNTMFILIFCSAR